MASQVLSGSSNPSYTNNTNQNVRIVINYMNATSTGDVTLNWAGVSITESNVEAFGKHIACASSFYGDYFYFPGTKWNWWRKLYKDTFFPLTPRAATSTQNVAIRMPSLDADFPTNKKRFRQWIIDTLNNNISGFSFAIALPLEVFLAPGQTFSAICGVYNIVVIKEDGN